MCREAETALAWLLMAVNDPTQNFSLVATNLSFQPKRCLILPAPQQHSRQSRLAIGAATIREEQDLFARIASQRVADRALQEVDQRRVPRHDLVQK